MGMKKAHRGFTLMEILAVISIIGLLASIVMPKINAARERATITSAVMELDALKTVFQQLYGDTKKYPNGVSSLCRNPVPSNNEVDLSQDTAGLIANGSGWANWNGPYIQDTIDPWGNPYFFDEDYQCSASTTGCRGINDTGEDSSVVVSCGKNAAFADGACAYDEDNVVYRLCN
jgi:general secretion pathway protein G